MVAVRDTLPGGRERNEAMAPLPHWHSVTLQGEAHGEQGMGHGARCHERVSVANAGPCWTTGHHQREPGGWGTGPRHPKLWSA